MIALQSLISLALLFVLVFVLYNSHRVDLLRQKLFFIRDGLFDEALAGRISFDSKSYKYTRTTLNGMIRFSHRVSVSRFVTAIVLSTEEDYAEAKQRVASIHRASSESDRAICQTYLTEANRAVIKHLGTSPLALLVFAPAIAGVFTLVTGHSFLTTTVKNAKKLMARLDFVAYEEGRATLVSHRQGFVATGFH